MELIHAIAEYLEVPNERVNIQKVIGEYVWFEILNGGNNPQYSCRTVRGGKYLKKNSIRIDY